jgi:polysaccharide lyase-like protein
MNARLWFLAAVAVLAVGAATYADEAGRSPDGILRGPNEAGRRPTETRNVPDRIVWKADAERPVDREWASMRAEAAGPSPCENAYPSETLTPRISRSSTVVAQGRYSYAITAVPGDQCDGERAELAQGNPERDGFANRVFNAGDDRYISFQVLLDRNVDLTAPGWRLIAQLHQAGNLGTPALSLNVEAGQFVLYRSDANVESYDTVSLWEAPASKGRWVRFTLHVRFSSDPAEGYVELWGNPAGGDVVPLLGPVPMATMKRDASGETVPDHARIGLFRDENGLFGTETVYYDGFTVATTRTAAERNAFR